jgi:CheY-like chemotaxis protein
MKRILVVEDNQANIYLIDFILSHSGYVVIKAGTGEEGVDLAATERPDLVLMDIQLPGIDGLETTRRIRRAEKGRHVPIVALTSFAMAGDRERALAAGCTGYIEKPINPDTFVHDIEAHMTGAATRSEQEERP